LQQKRRNERTTEGFLRSKSLERLRRKDYRNEKEQVKEEEKGNN